MDVQVKADLIRQREVELLKPSAGPGASEILHLLRPAAEDGSAVAVEAEQQQDAAVQKQMSPLRWATASFCATTETLAAAAEAVFGTASSAVASNGTVAPATSETLLGLSCAISRRGEVHSIIT